MICDVLDWGNGEPMESCLVAEGAHIVAATVQPEATDVSCKARAEMKRHVRKSRLGLLGLVLAGAPP